MGAKEVQDNSWQVLKYLEIWHHIEPSAQGSDEPYDHKARGEWRPPIGEPAHDVIDANSEVTTILSPLLEELAHSPASYNGVIASELFSTLRNEPGMLPNIRAEGGREWEALRKFCYLVAQMVAAEWDGPSGPYKLKVVLSKREIKEALRSPNESPPGKARTWTAHNSYRIISEEIDNLMAKGMSEAAARGYLMDYGLETPSGAVPISGPRITRARAFVREERGAA